MNHNFLQLNPDQQTKLDDLEPALDVRRVSPDLQFRAFGFMLLHGGDDPPEAICRACFQAWTTDWPELRALEDQLSAQDRGGTK